MSWRLDLRLGIGAAMVLLAVWAFWVIAHGVVQGRALGTADAALAEWVRYCRSPAMSAAMLGISTVGAPLFVVLVTLLTSAALGRHGHRRLGLVMALGVYGGMLINTGLKFTFERQRPETLEALIAEHGFSFPSGHVVGATLLYGFGALLAARWLRTTGGRAAAAVGAMVLVGLVALSRVYLGVHYLSDVLAAIALGVAWLSLLTPLLGPAPARPGRVGAPTLTDPVIREVGVVLNPRAGARGPSASSLVRLLRGRGLEATVAAAATPAEVPEITRRLVERGHSVVVAAGGDGTISGVASVLAGTRTVMGVLPLGTLNHFAKDLGIPRGLERAIGTLSEGRIAEVDAGEVNGRVFVNNVSLGLYPAYIRAQGRRRDPSRWARWRTRVAAALLVARRMPVFRARIWIDGREVHRWTPLVFIGNSEYRVRGRRLGSRRGIDSGRLCLITTDRRGPLGLLVLGLRAIAGARAPRRGGPGAGTAAALEYAVGTEVRVRLGQARTLVAIDGEIVEMETPVRCVIRPRALRVLVPRSAPRPGRRGD